MPAQSGCLDLSTFSVKNGQEHAFEGIKDLLENPKKNKAMTILKMLLVIILPMITLLSIIVYDLVAAINSQSMADSSQEITTKMESVNKLVYNMQKERGFTGGQLKKDANFTALKEFRENTDLALSKVTIWPGEFSLDGQDVSDPVSFKLFLDSFRDFIDQIIQTNLTNTFDLTFSVFLTYTKANSALISFAGSYIEMPAVSNIWKTPVTTNFLIQISEYYGQMRALGVLFFAWCHLTPMAYTQLSSANGSVLNLLQRINFLKPGLQDQILKSMQKSSSVRNLPMLWDGVQAAMTEAELCTNLTLKRKSEVSDEWFAAFTSIIDVIFHFRSLLVDEFDQQMESFSTEMKNKTIGYVLIFILINLVSIFLLIWFSSRLNQLLGKLATFAGDIRAKSHELAEEKKKASNLLHRMLPAEVVEQLMAKKEVKAQHYDRVTIYFSDIVKFTEISGMSSPLQIVDMLNALYSGFDELIEKYQVYKVETIGDAYMVAAGVPKVIPEPEKEMALLSFDLLAFAKGFRIGHLPQQELLLRIGMHSGSVVAGVVGMKMPRYCLFGDTVNTASRMESHGQAKRIHISGSVHKELVGVAGFKMIERGPMEIKGKGVMLTYWLEN